MKDGISKMRKIFIFSACIFLFITIIPVICTGQIPGYNMNLCDSLIVEDSLITSFKIINFNEDEYYDYYIATDERSYIIDGSSKDTLWISNYSEFRKYENLEYIESLDVWRCFIVEHLPDNENNFRLKFVDVPNVTAQDSIDFCMYIYTYVGGPFMAGYLPFDNGSYYAYIAEHYPSSESTSDTGRLFQFNPALDSLLYEFISGGFPTSHYNIRINNFNYFLIVGNDKLQWFGHYPRIDYSGIARLYNEDFEIVSDFSSQAQNYSSSDTMYDSSNNTYQLLLSGNGKVLVCSDIFDDTQYFFRAVPVGNTYAQYIDIEHEAKVIIGKLNGYMELLNTDLSFYRYTFGDAPVLYNDLLTEDIDFDGTDEVFYICDSIIRIIKLENATGIDETSSPLPYLTTTSYPNPFNASTTISYDLPEKADISLEVYDVLGRKIETLISTTQPAGHHQAVWHAGDLPSGVYFYKLAVDEITKTEKMVLMK